MTLSLFKGDCVDELNKITLQIHIRKFEEQTTNPEDPMDVRNDPQQGNPPQVVCSLDLLM